jgi:hypothetical protein
MSLNKKTKSEVVPPLTPRNAMPLDSIVGVRREMGRLYRLSLNGRLPADELTKLVFTLREIRCCLEAEALTDVQQRLVVLSRNMDKFNGHHIPHQPTYSDN